MLLIEKEKNIDHLDFKENDQFFKFARHVSTELLSSSVE